MKNSEIFCDMLKKFEALSDITETSMDQINKQYDVLRTMQNTLMKESKRRAISVVRLRRQVADLEEWLEERTELQTKRMELLTEVL